MLILLACRTKDAAHPSSAHSAAHATSNWDATRDFVGPSEPRLTPLEQLAQVLLMANELMFVD